MTVSSTYIANRKQYQRPQAMIWSEDTPVVTDGKLIPVGYEVGSDLSNLPITAADSQFLILSDHNRAAVEVKTDRIEQRKRMANGTMRSYHIADKLVISTSWELLPSRGFDIFPNFVQEDTPILLNGGLEQLDRVAGEPQILLPSDNDEPFPNTYYANKSQQYTVDGGAGGGELLDWYESHTGPFWVMLSYDKYNNFGDSDSTRNHLAEYSQTLQMYISEFTYSVEKRGGNNFDMWNVSVTLEEV